MSAENKTSRKAQDAECAVCWELMDEPLMLPCKHSFCTKCMKKLVATGVLQAPMVKKEIRIRNRIRM